MLRIRLQFLAIALMAVSCGGGGGGGTGTPAPSPTPAPTLKLQASASKVFRDNLVTLTWTSSHASSCTAAGAWDGSPALQGSEALVLTETGTKRFDLTCTGAGGSSTATATVTVALDPSKDVSLPAGILVRPADFPANYPTAFQAQPATVTVNDPYCGINNEAVGIPADYLGTFPLPSPQGKLPASWLRIVGLKDYYPVNPSSNNNCPTGKEYARAAYKVALDRAARVGADAVWVYNYATWKDLTQPSWEIELSQISIPDDEMAWLVAEAAKRNLKVYLEWQLLPFDTKGNVIPNAPTLAQLQTLLKSYENVIVARGAAAQQQGIVGMQADWAAFWISNGATYRSTFSEGMLSVLQKLRPVFKGKIGFGVQGIVDPAHLPYIDFLRLELNSVTVSATDYDSLTVDRLKAGYLSYIDWLASGWLPTTVPVMWGPLIQSTRDWYVTGWIEDGFCVNSCVQYGVDTDYSVQALGMEAMFQAITVQSKFPVAGIHYISGYWLSDSSIPSPPSSPRAAFPNVSQTVRNKPAEAIIEHWFRKN